MGVATGQPPVSPPALEQTHGRQGAANFNPIPFCQACLPCDEGSFASSSFLSVKFCVDDCLETDTDAIAQDVLSFFYYSQTVIKGAAVSGGRGLSVCLSVHATD